ncbi:hypothetical protein DPMN_114367 [Dreissena polymorpha]|uniref:Uncharacterized protein n=1 Tax=Dreissena polymorpha TaxID=45954 RepID=A0A9D4KJZ1_DREPO|nr:hypothetical protein DPMN_114367 [Dreissena polymorpha]
MKYLHLVVLLLTQPATYRPLVLQMVQLKRAQSLMLRLNITVWLLLIRSIYYFYPPLPCRLQALQSPSRNSWPAKRPQQD